MKVIKLFVLLAASAFLFACGSISCGNDNGSPCAATFKSNGGSAFANLSTAGATGGSGGDYEASLLCIAIIAMTMGPMLLLKPKGVNFLSGTIDPSGGNGATSGGHDGYYEIYTNYYWTGDDYTSMPVGSIVNQMPVFAKWGAGNMTASDGRGSGGYYEFNCYNDTSRRTTITAGNSGVFDFSGRAFFAGSMGRFLDRQQLHRTTKRTELYYFHQDSRRLGVQPFLSRPEGRVSQVTGKLKVGYAAQAFPDN